MKNVVLSSTATETAYEVEEDCTVVAVAGLMGGLAILSTVPNFDVATLAGTGNFAVTDVIAMLTGGAAAPSWSAVNQLGYPLRKGEFIRLITDGNQCLVNVLLDVQL